jgi:hypothetical protein
MGLRRGCATFVVAANDSSAADKAQADYVCAGAGDQSTIQAAIDAVELGIGADPQHHGKSGAVILLLPGRYSFNGLLTIDKNIFLMGSGFTATEIVLADGSNCGMIRYTNFESAPGDVTYGSGISHMRLDGNIANQVGDWWDMYGLLINASDAYFDHIWIDKCGVGLRSASLWSTYFNQISIEACTQAGWLNADASNRLLYVQFTGCNIHQKFQIRAAAASSYNSEISFRDCNFGGADPQAYDSLEFEGNNYNCLVDGCKFKGQPAAGYYDIKTSENAIGSSQNISVIGCTFPATAGGGNIYLSTSVDYCTIMRNRFSHATPIVLQGGATNANGNVFRNYGYATENSGTATLVNGTTSIAVAHGLAVTPAAGDIGVTPIEAWGNMTTFYIDTYTSTHFTIHSPINPGQDVDFAWKAIVL